MERNWADTVCAISDFPDGVGTIAPDDSPDNDWHFARASNFADGVGEISHPR
jgi:hypothetical protein